MANYLTGACHKKTAVLEWNNHGDFEKMKKICIKKTENKTPFRILAADYYAAADAGVWMDCMNRGYNRVILDCGEAAENRLYDCARCDRVVVVGSLTEWQLTGFLEFLEQEGKPDTSWIYTAVFGSDQARKQLEKRFCRKILKIPLSVDAFTISRADMYFFVSLLN